MKTELISSWKIVNNKVRDMYIVNTASGQSVWVNKSQFSEQAESIDYRVMKAGDEYTNSKGEIAQLKADRNEYLGCGKQVIKKYTSVEILDHLVSKGITPTFSMS